VNLTPWRLQLPWLFLFPILYKLFLWRLQTPIIFIYECRWSCTLLDKLFSNLLIALCSVLLLIWLLLMVLFFRLILFFFVGNNMIILFWVHYLILFQWMYCILSSIAKPHTMFGILLSKNWPLHLILILCKWIFFRSSSGWWFNHYICCSPFLGSHTKIRK
jgi:hypothetical protein